MLGIIVFGIIAVLMILLILSFIAPQNSDRRFWIVIRKMRDGIDLFSYWLFNAIVICLLLFVVSYIVWKYVL